MNKDTLYVIHFDGKPSSEDEIISKNSDRIAAQGCFTNRPDLPRWVISRNATPENPEEKCISNQMPGTLQILLAQQKGGLNLDLISKKEDGEEDDSEAGDKQGAHVEILPGGIEIPASIGQD